MRLKELRKFENKTQQEIAQFLNMTQVSYGRYELETSEPTLQTLCKLADYYKVSLDYLVGRDFANDFGYMSDDEKGMVRGFRQLNKINQVKLLAQLEGLLLGQE